MKILIGITSSIASYKIYDLIRLYKKNNHEVKVVITPNASLFVSPLVLETLSNNKVYVEQFSSRDDIEHISLCDWADIIVLAPLSANTLSKIASGICDNLLTSVFCAYLGSKKPVLLAPAMNDGMWDNPIIKLNVKKLVAAGCFILEPEEGFLACGKNAKGRLAKIELIYQHSLRLVFQNKKNNNKKLVVTLGGTKEKIDSVRCITNFSSGKMGQALCQAAFLEGYEVIALSTFEYDAPYKVIVTPGALDMLNELIGLDFDYLFMAAAVGDFRIASEPDYKITKEEIAKNSDEVEFKFILNPDVVKTISQNKRDNQVVTGFCLADRDVLETAKKKLKDKNLDYIVANNVNTALGTDENKVTIITKSGKIIDIGLDKKENIAKEILTIVSGG